jgi:Na+-transporting methylmalonyl-CoA/oxaloacetate decarboxylase gamma subunit
MKVIVLKIFFCLSLVLSFGVIKGQGIKNIRINEILVKNDSNCIDQYGVRSGWFELFNTGYAMADVGGCFVTNDIDNPTKYRIPKGDPRTQIASRTYSLFYAYNSVDRGIFHVNFSLDEIGFLALFDHSGRILIDSVSYDIDAQQSNISFGKMENVPLEKAQWEIMKEPTPNAINYTVVEKTRGEKYAETDKHGFIITVTTMTIVFIVLALLAVIFITTGRYFKKKANSQGTQSSPHTQGNPTKEGEHDGIAMVVKYFKRRRRKSTHNQKTEIQSLPSTEEVPDTNALDLAAIAMALHLYFDDQHEIEETGFWLNRPLNQQTPWSAKHILFKKSPRKK